MSRTIVVPLDGSPLAERALPYAVSLAKTQRSRLVLVRVALGPAPATLDGSDWERGQLAAVAESERYLDSVSAVLPANLDVACEVPYGHAAKQILAAVRRVGADQIVMSTHGRTGLAHLLHGSVAEEILAASQASVLLVHARPNQSAGVPFDAQTASVLVPLDGSSLSQRALPEAVKFLSGETGRAALVLVTVVAEPDHVEFAERGRVVAYLDQQEEARTRAARDYLETMAQQVRDMAPGLVVSTDVRMGRADEGIGMAAAAHAIDLIIMATHARTGLQRARLGSIAGAVVRTANTPVLLVGRGAEAAAQAAPRSASGAAH